MAGKDKGKQKTAGEKLTSRDSQLAGALDELEQIDTGRHSNSDEYDDVIEALAKLHKATDRFYDNPIGTKADLKAVRDAYQEVRDKCDTYLAKNKGFRFSSLGKQRKSSIQAIREIVDRDMFVMDEDHPEYSHKKNLKELLESARKSTVVIDDPKAVKGIGGSISSRIPVAIQGENGEEKGFFTERSVQENEDQIAARICGQFKDKKGISDVLSTVAVADQTDKMLDIYYSMDRTMNSRGLAVDRETACASPKAFCDFYADPMRKLFGKDKTYEQLLEIAKDPEVRGNLDAFFRETFRSYRGHHFNCEVGMIEEGREIATRNVATYRLASRLGMADVIAKAETMDLRVGDRSMKGVFMHAAAGEDLNRQDLDSELSRIFIDRNTLSQAMELPGVKRQLSDLQILDYLCGNTDRHEGNLLYQTATDSSGKPYITGITGIDNDLSFGDLDECKGAMVDPSSFRVVSKGTREAIQKMTPAELAQLMGDLGFSPQEMSAAQRRLQTLQNTLSRVMPFDPLMPVDLQLAAARKSGQILEFNGEEDLAKISFASLDEGNNYFHQLREAPSSVRSRLVIDGDGIRQGEIGKLNEAYMQAPHRSRAAERRLDAWYETQYEEISRKKTMKEHSYAVGHRATLGSFLAKLAPTKVRRSVGALAQEETASKKASSKTSSAKADGAARRKEKRKSAKIDTGAVVQQPTGSPK